MKKNFFSHLYHHEAKCDSVGNSEEELHQRAASRCSGERRIALHYIRNQSVAGSEHRNPSAEGEREKVGELLLARDLDSAQNK